MGRKACGRRRGGRSADGDDRKVLAGRAWHRSHRDRPVQGDKLPAVVDSEREQIGDGDLAVAEQGCRFHC